MPLLSILSKRLLAEILHFLLHFFGFLERSELESCMLHAPYRPICTLSIWVGQGNDAQGGANAWVVAGINAISGISDGCMHVMKHYQRLLKMKSFA